MSNSDGATETILVALDGSPTARTAASIAVQLAASLNWGIAGLYILDTSMVYDIYANYRRELGNSKRANSRAELVTWFSEQGNRALDWLEDRCRASDIQCRTELLYGGIPELVLAKAPQAELLALGRRGHGHHGDQNHLGRHFRAIAHHTPVPLLIGGGKWRTVERLLLAYDGSEHARAALAWAVDLQRALHCQIVVVGLEGRVHMTQTWLPMLQAQIDSSELANYELMTNEVWRAFDILDLAEERRTDLIIIGGYHYPEIIERLIGSTLDGVVRNSQLPLLVV